MIWYFLLFYSIILLIINGFLPFNQRNGKISRLIFIFTSFILLFLLLFRGYDVGEDWGAEIGYVKIYSEIPPIWDLYKVGGLKLTLEPGFQLYISLLKSLGLHVNFVPFFLLLSSLILIYKACIRYDLQLLVVLTFFILSVYLHFYEQLRMAFVYSISVVTFLSYLNNNKRDILIFASIATLFQYIGLILFLLYFLKINTAYSLKLRYKYFYLKSRFKLKIIFYSAIFFISLCLFGQYTANLFDHIILRLPNFFILDKFLLYYKYTSHLNESSILGTIFLITLLLFIFLTFKSVDYHKIDRINKLSIMMLFFLIFSIQNLILPIITFRLYGIIVYSSFIIVSEQFFFNRNNYIFFNLISLFFIYRFIRFIKVIGDYELIIF